MTSKGESIQHISDKVKEGQFVEHESKGGLGRNVGNAEKENEGCLGKNAEEQEVINSIEYLGDADELEDILKDFDEIEETSSTENTYVDVREIEEGVRDKDDCDDDSVDGSYVAQSESVHSDTEVSLEDDFDVTEHSGDDDVDGLLDERDSLVDMDGSRSKPWFTVGMTFIDKDKLRRVIDKYAIVNGVNVKIVRSEKKKLLATCQAGCPFRLYASRDGDNIGRASSEQNISTWKGNFSPKCLDLFETNRYLANKCRVSFNGDDGYEVSEGQDRHSVLITRKMCTCRAWDLTGIPCQHAICAMYHAKIDPITQISHYYHKDTYIASYRTKFKPVRGKQFWEIDKYLPMLPPPVCKLPGRPPKKRIRTEEKQRRLNMSTTQSSSSTTAPYVEKLSRKGVLGRCSVCRKEGHNKSTCREAPPSNNPRPGRKRKTTLAQPTPPSLSPKFQAPKPASNNPQTLNLAQRKGYVYKARNKFGFGITIDEVTGRTIYNPGLTSEVVIAEGAAPHYQYGELQTKFPIPNEKQLRMSTASTSSTQKGSRKIIFTSQESSVSQPLPVKPPGLMWKGHQSISSSQLQQQRQRIMTRSKASSNI